MPDWTSAPLGDLLDVVIDHRGKTPKKLGGDFTDAGIRVISAIHIKHGRINWSERLRFVSPEMYRRWMPIPLIKGDVLVTSEAPLGQIAQVSTNGPLVLSQRLFALRGHADRLDNGFLRYYLSSVAGQAALTERATGTTVTGIRQSELLKVRVPLPPLDVQRGIARVLGALDDLIDTNQRLITSCRSMASQIYKTQAGNNVPFSTIAALVRDTVRPQDVDPDTPYLGLEHFNENGGGISGCGRAGDTESSKSRFKSGDVLYGKLRPYFRKVDRPGFSGVCTTEAWVLRPREGHSTALLASVVASQEFTDWAMRGSSGTRMPRANWEHVGQLSVSLPESSRLPSLDTASQSLWESVWTLSDENRAVSATRDELLPLLLSGQVLPGEVSD